MRKKQENRNGQLKENRCPICASIEVSVFFEITDVPVHIGIQWPNPDAARLCPKGDIKLAFCQDCGFIENLAFNPALVEYTQVYDNSLGFSPFFQEYSRSLALRLIKRYNLYHKDVIEIGCGKGDFLLLLCELGNNRGVGFDPSYEGKRTPSQVTERITFIQDFYSEEYASNQADLICCRFVLEHIRNPVDFLKMVRRTIGNRSNTVVYFGVPNVFLILHDLSIWDIIYEHYSCFSIGSLARLFTLTGFDVCHVSETYEGQIIGIEAFPGNGLIDPGRDQWGDFKEIAQYVTAFADNYKRKIEKWQYTLEQIKRKGQQSVIWGAGAKGVSFLNMLKIKDEIQYVVDINPHKQGKYIAGTGQQIVSPKFLRDYRPDVVIVMNPIYKSEIQQILEGLDLSVEFLFA